MFGEPDLKVRYLYPKFGVGLVAWKIVGGIGGAMWGDFSKQVKTD